MRLALVALAALLAQGQTARQAPATVEGVVVGFGTSEPMAGARVQIIRQRNMVPVTEEDRFLQKSVTTGADGRFTLDGITPAEYRLYATRSGGFVPGEFGQRSPAGLGIPFTLTPGQRMTGAVLALTPTGSIAGRVYDVDGEPLARALVQALKPVYRDGQRALTITQAVLSNDRGEYRLFWLTPGSYYISVKPAVEDGPYAPIRISEPARFGTFEQSTRPVIRSRAATNGELVEEVLPTVYFPGTTDAAGASRVDLRPGAMADGVDVRTAAPVRTRHLRGRIIDGATAQPVVGASVAAIPNSYDPGLTVPSATSRAGGEFDLAGLLPGSYLLVSTNRGATGIMPIQVGDADVDNVMITVSNGFPLNGRITVEGQLPNDRTLPFRLELQREPGLIGMPSGGPSFNPPAAADGSFTAEGIHIGDFRATVGFLPQGAYVKSMRLGTVDVLDAGLHVTGPFGNPLEIVIGANGGRLAGSVASSRDEPVFNATIVLVPEAARRRRTDLYETASTDARGRFEMQGLTPGDYRIFAWEDVEAGAWFDPEFMRAYENRGSRVRIDEGREASVQLVLP
jgi:protocatechuate 3,4-dioxygenase beta subunit